MNYFCFKLWNEDELKMNKSGLSCKILSKFRFKLTIKLRNTAVFVKKPPD